MALVAFLDSRYKAIHETLSPDAGLYLTWGAVGFSFVAPFLTVQVWQQPFDISRALAPLVTAFVLEMFVASRRKSLENST